MCVKEFFGYACGHCSPPTLVICPLTAQDPTFAPCPLAAERAIPCHGQYCPGCARALWNNEVLRKENEHRALHELGECSYEQCGTAFTEEERLAIPDACKQLEVSKTRAIKQAVDVSHPQVSGFHGMVVEYTGSDEETGPPPTYIHTPHENMMWDHHNGITNQSQLQGRNYQGNRQNNRGNRSYNPGTALQRYQQPWNNGQSTAHGEDLAIDFASGRGHGYPRHARRRANHRNRIESGESYGLSGGNANYSRTMQRDHNPSWDQTPPRKFTGNNQLLSPLDTATRNRNQAAFAEALTYAHMDSAKSQMSESSAVSPCTTPARKYIRPEIPFHAYDPRQSSYPIPEKLRTASPLPRIPSVGSIQNQQLIELQFSRVKANARRIKGIKETLEQSKSRRDAVVDLPAGIAELVDAVENEEEDDEESSSSGTETFSYPGTPRSEIAVVAEEGESSSDFHSYPGTPESSGSNTPTLEASQMTRSLEIESVLDDGEEPGAGYDFYVRRRSNSMPTGSSVAGFLFSPDLDSL